MANDNAPYGFVPLNSTTGLISTTAFTIGTGYGTAIGFGDPVALTGTGVGQYASIGIGVSLSPIVGIFQGYNYTDSNGQPQFAKNWVANTTATNVVARVITDPLVEYRAQLSGSFAITDYSQDVAFVIGTPNTLGMSTTYLDSTTIGTGTDFQIRRLYDSPNNSVGTYAQVIGVFRLSSYNYPYTAV